MGRRNETPEKKALREMTKEYLKQHPLKDGNDVKDMMREMLSVVLDGSLEG